MQSPGPGSSLRSEMNVTPLVDIVLVLLIIFIVITPAVDQAVRLPRARHGKPVQDPGSRITLVLGPPALVRLEESGAYYPLGEGSALAGFLAARLAAQPDLPVCIKADAALPFAKVQRLLDLVRESGGACVQVITGEDTLPGRP